MSEATSVASQTTELSSRPWVVALTWAASPTLGISRRWKPDDPRARTTALHWWNNVLLADAAGIALLLSVEPITSLGARWGFALLASWRANELFIAFIADAWDRLHQRPPQTTLLPSDRILCVLRGYTEIWLDFSILYFMLPDSWFHQTTILSSGSSESNGFTGISQALFLSASTLLPLNADVTFGNAIARFIAIYEAVIGVAFLVFVLSAYLMGTKRFSSDPPIDSTAPKEQMDSDNSSQAVRVPIKPPL